LGSCLRDNGAGNVIAVAWLAKVLALSEEGHGEPFAYAADMIALARCARFWLAQIRANISDPASPLQRTFRPSGAPRDPKNA